MRTKIYDLIADAIIFLFMGILVLMPFIALIALVKFALKLLGVI